MYLDKSADTAYVSCLHALIRSTLYVANFDSMCLKRTLCATTADLEEWRDGELSRGFWVFRFRQNIYILELTKLRKIESQMYIFLL